MVVTIVGHQLLDISYYNSPDSSLNVLETPIAPLAFALTLTSLSQIERGT